MTIKQFLVMFSIDFFVLFYCVPSSAWTISNSFDTQNVGEHCSPLWNGTASIVTGVQSYSASHSCRFHIEAGSDGGGGWGGGINFPAKQVKGNQLWVRIRTFWPVGSDFNSYSGGNRLKFLRFRTNSAPSVNDGYNDWYINSTTGIFNTPYSWIYEGENSWVDFGTFGHDAIQKGQWETYEYYIKFDNVPASQGGQALVRLWKNGVLLKEITNRKTLKTTETYSTDLLIFTYWNGNSPKTQDMYVDDLVVTSDTPSAQDASGNHYIGMGSAPTGKSVTSSPPLPPGSIK